MVRQYDAQLLCDIELRKHIDSNGKSLWDNGWRTNFTKTTNFIAACWHDQKRITISIPHLQARSESELKDTIWHEVAHALVGHGNGHNNVWRDKAIELGCVNPTPCGATNLEEGRSLNPAEVKEAKKIKSIETYCPFCQKVFISTSQVVMNGQIWMMGECGHIVGKDTIKDVVKDIAGWTSNTGKTVFPYQVDGIKFVAEANGKALIADEPGLGKTIQALGALKFYPEMRPCLWVCKTTLKIQALKEAIDWCGAEMMGQIIEHKKMFIIPGLNLYIVSMDLLRNLPTEKIEEIPFKTVVADEIQHFKNPDSSRTAELRKLVSKAEYFIPLSGTPWKNRGSEYFPVLNMLRPEMFPSPKHFKAYWVDEYQDPKTGKWKEGGIRNIPKFRELTKDFIIRRLRDDVLPDLPPIDRRIRFVDMEAEFTKSYDKNEEQVAAMVKAAMLEGKSMKDIASMIMKLKHITGLAKVKACVEDVIEWLENVPDEFEKMTVFHHHIDVGDKLQEGLDDWLVKNGYNKSLRLFGGRSPQERDKVIMDFKADIKNRILIGSTLASGEGLNIQFCQNAYMLERQWNPANEEQAELRFSRPLTIGDLPEYLHPIANRKISIRIPYFIAVDTIDEFLTNIVERKRINFRKSMNDKDANMTWDENDIIQELAEEIIRKKYKK
jgi:SNF2 family DNA or RNA helicase